MAARSAIKIDIGSTWRRTLIYKDSLGARVNLTGYTGQMQIRQSFGSTVLLELTVANGRISIEAEVVDTDTMGVIVLKLTDEATADIAPGAAVYDLLITNAAGEAFRLLEGAVTFRPAVTRNE